ncbi:MAG: GIY-YIG nuclease family protein [Abditibacteriaceae bacterium]
MKVYFVYILRCSDASYYTGITNDVEQRISDHNAGIDPDSYTFSRRPVELCYTASFKNPNEAIAFEKQIKGWSRKKKEALIEGNWNKIQQEAECKNVSHYRNKP